MNPYYIYVTVHAKRGIFAYATEIAFLISLQRASVVLANGVIGSVTAVTDPTYDTLKQNCCQTQYVKQLYFRLVNKMMTSLIVQSQANQIKTIEI